MKSSFTSFIRSIILIILVLLLSWLIIMSLTNAVLAQITADEVFKNFQSKYQKSKNFSADFEEITFISPQKSLSKGKLVFQKPNMLRKEYKDPNDESKISQLILSNGKIIWSYTPWLNQATKQELKSSEVHKEILPGAGSSLEKLKDSHNLTLVDDPVAKKKGIYLLQFTPKKEVKDPTFDTIQAWIRPADWLPLQFSYEDKSNNMTLIIQFVEKSIRVDEKLSSSTFEFQPPKGTEIVEVPD